jgi:hypothetical protein
VTLLGIVGVGVALGIVFRLVRFAVRVLLLLVVLGLIAAYGAQHANHTSPPVRAASGQTPTLSGGPAGPRR